MWIFLAIVSSLLLGFYDVAKKHALRENAVLPVLFTATLAGSLPFLAILALNSGITGFGPPSAFALQELSRVAHLQILAKSVLVGFSWIFAFFALKHLPISLVAPIRSSAPAWTVLGATLIFGERLSGLQWLGIGVTFGSYYLLAVSGRMERIEFTRNRWISYALVATLTGSLSALYDKFLILRYPPLAMQCWFYFYLILVLGSIVLTLWAPGRSRYTLFQWRWSIPVIGIFLAASDFAYFKALAEPGAMISLVSVVRRSSVATAFVAGSLLFHEQNKRYKAVAVGGVILGIFLIVMSRP